MVQIHRASRLPTGPVPNAGDLDAARTYTDEQITRRSFSAYLGLVRNGGGVLSNNDNFSQFDFVADDLVAGGGSFRVRAGLQGSAVYPDDLIAVNPDRPLRLSFFAKAQAQQVNNFFSAVAAFDLDGNQIQAIQWLYKGGTTTSISQDLNPGDTVIHVESTSNWTTDGEAYQRSIIFWDYENSQGYRYPPETYSRHLIYRNAYVPTELTDTSIPLSEPYKGARVTAGTKISNGSDGGVYAYIGAIGATLDTKWRAFQGYSGGVGDGSNRAGNALPPGTAFVRPLLMAYGATEPYLINMLQLSEVIQ